MSACQRFQVFAALAAMPLLLLLNSGCPLASGAHLTPTVKYRPSTTETAATESTAAAASATTETAAAEGVGTLHGKVILDGPFTPLPPLYVKGADVRDSAVCAAVEAPNESIVVNDGGLANVFIYLRKAPKVVPPAPTGDVILDQKNCVFKPHAMAVRVGQTVMVLNSDPIAHNTHTNGKKTVPFNSVISPNETKGIPLVYKQSEQDPIPVTCDVHSWMRAYHLPIDHPFVAVSAGNGTFEIKDLPAGKHEFKVWHESGGLIEKALVVNIKPGEDNELTIKVLPAQLKK